MPGPFVPSGSLCPRHGRRGVPPCQQVVQRDQNVVALDIGIPRDGAVLPPVSYTHLDVYKRQGLYWKAAAAAHPEEADCALYWQNARDRLQAMRDGTAHGDNARAIGRMLEELD